MNTTAGNTPSSQMEGLADLLFESSLDCMKVLDPDGRIVRINQNGLSLMEAGRESAVLGHRWSDLWSPSTRTQVEEAVQRARSGGPSRFSAPCPTIKGSPRWWDVTVTPMRDRAGNVISILALSHDVTHLYTTKASLRKTAARLQFVLDTGGIGDWELDFTTGSLTTSPLFERIVGTAPEPTGWTYEHLLQAVLAADRAEVSRQFRQAADCQSEFAFVCRLDVAEDLWRWIEVRGSRYDDGSGDARLIGTVRDISEMKWAEEELREITASALSHAKQAEEERSRLEATLVASPIAIIHSDADHVLRHANPAHVDLWGALPYTTIEEAAINLRVWHADGSKRHGQRLRPEEAPLARALRGEKGVETMLEVEPHGAFGVRKIVMVRATPMLSPAGEVTGAVAASMDITAHMLLEEELRRSEAKFRTITDAMPQMVWSSCQDGQHDYFNQRWFDFTGLDAAEQHAGMWAEAFHAGDRERLLTDWQSSLEAGSPFEAECRLRHHEGDYRWVLVRALPVRDEAGIVIRWMGTCTDVHEQRSAQELLQESEEALRQADRRKDEFLAMLAHELRNPLAPIAAASEIVRRAQHDPVRIEGASRIIARQVRHMATLVADLLDVSRVTRGLVNLDCRVFDLKDAIRAAEEQARPLIEGRKHRLTLLMPSEVLLVRGDRARLSQVFTNLLNNAAKFTPIGGNVEVSAARKNGFVEVRVRDTGIGISPEFKPYIFDLFAQGDRSPDRALGGLGVGLPLVRSIVSLHGGLVTAHSDGPDLGSLFRVELPEAVQQVAEVRNLVHAAAAPRPTPKRVVVIDDNLDVIESIGSLLEVEGHQVRVFSNAEDAESGAAPADTDIYIIDIGLPGMTGTELVQRFRAMPGGGRPRYFALTGYGQAHDVRSALDAGFDQHFTKPIDPLVLLSLMDDAWAPTPEPAA